MYILILSILRGIWIVIVKLSIIIAISVVPRLCHTPTQILPPSPHHDQTIAVPIPRRFRMQLSREREMMNGMRNEIIAAVQ